MTYKITPPFKISGGGVINLKACPKGLDSPITLTVQYSPCEEIHDFAWLDNSSMQTPDDMPNGKIFFDNPVMFGVFKENIDVNFLAHKKASWVRCVYEFDGDDEPNLTIEFKESTT
jgi:hypothetical protein